MKTCTYCDETKPYTAFTKRTGSKDGYHNRCKPCRSEVQKQRYRAKSQEDIRDRDLKKAYGIGIDEYNALYAQQGGCCAICATHSENAPKKRLYVDHNHLTGVVRGLLCGNCNAGLGLLKDDIDVIIAALAYLQEKGSYGRITTPPPANDIQ